MKHKTFAAPAVCIVVSFICINTLTTVFSAGGEESRGWYDLRGAEARTPQATAGGQESRPVRELRKEYFEGREAVAGEALVRFRDIPGKDKAAAGVSQEWAASEYQAKLAALDQELDAETDVEVGGRGTRLIRSRSRDVASLVYQLSARPDVLFAEPNYLVYGDAVPNDPSFPSQWNMRNNFRADIDAVSAWNATVGSPRNPVVAVLDTGVDYNHPDLTGNMWSAPTAFTVTLNGRTINCAAGTHGFNTITKSCDPLDDNGHGTHVAGIIGATGNNGLGVAGVNWATSIMAIKLLDSAGAGVGTIADTLDAFEFVRQVKLQFAPTDSANVRVLNTSWGESAFSQALLEEINAANSSDMLLVAAAGNTGTDNDAAPHYPSGYDAPNVVAVAATDNSGTLTSFSNFGASGVDLAAPGLFINSTLPGSTYGSRDGTSMATPHVAGAAALLLSRCALTTSALKAALLDNTDPDPTLTGKVATGGRLNVDTALRNACGLPNFTVSVTPASRLVSQGSSTTYTITVTATGGFTGAVTVSVHPPAGATPDFYSTNINTSGTATLTVTNNSIAPGTHPFLITAVSGDMHRAALTSLIAPDYFISAMPSAQSVQAGNSVNYTVNLTPIAGFTGPVTFSATGLPVGATATFTPSSVTTSGSTTLKLDTALTTTPGTYSFNIVGTAGGTQRTVPAVLTVTSPPPDFVFTGYESFIRAVNVSLTDREPLGVVPVGGFTGTISFSVSGLPAGAKAYFSPPTSSFPFTLMYVDPGTTNVDGTFPLTITASSGSLSHSVTTSLIIANSTFGSDGQAIDTLHPYNLDRNEGLQTTAMILQPDGKILVAARGYTFSSAGSFVERLNSDGSLDTSFGYQGRAAVSVSQPTDLALQPDGKILVVGYSFNDPEQRFSKIVLVRLNSNGSLDDGSANDSTPGDRFGEGSTYGSVTYSSNYYSPDQGNSVVVQPDGHIIVGGVVNIGPVLLRYNSSGHREALFDLYGGGYPEDIVIQVDGKLVVAGNTGEGFRVTRLNSDLSRDDGTNLDTTPGDSFGAGGWVSTTFDSPSDPRGGAFSVAVQPNGKIVLAGKALTVRGYEFALARYNSNGSLDTTFDQDGKLTTKFGSSSDPLFDEQASAVAIQPDGKIVAAGYALVGKFEYQEYDFALARYNSNGSLDAGFGKGGKKTTDFYGQEDKARGMVIQPDGKIVLAGDAKIFFPRLDNWRYWQFLALARYDGQTYSIGGNVAVGGVSLTGVTVNLSGSRTAAVNTDGNGNYSFTGLAAGENYTVTPAKTNYSFTPASKSYANLSANQVSQDFAATLKNYVISGKALNGATPLSSVTMTLTSPSPAGFAPRVLTTNLQGDFTFTGLPAGRSYTLTPTKTGYSFKNTSAATQSTRTYTNLSADQLSQNFAATPWPKLSVNDLKVIEGNATAVNATFTVKLSAASAQTVTVKYATANGTALSTSDYTALPLTTLTFSPGQTSKLVAVQVKGDTAQEPNETFYLKLSAATNATILDSSGTCTVNDNDQKITITDVTLTEGNAGTTAAVFTVKLSAASANVVTVKYATANGTALAPADYTARALTTLTFTPGQTSKTISVPVVGDTKKEPDETFFVNLSGAANATILDAQGKGTILNGTDVALLDMTPGGVDEVERLARLLGLPGLRLLLG